MAKVSVLMSLYKTNPGFLRDSISSILSQSYGDFEFLILDDCPEDDRERLVRSFKDNRIRYFKNEKNEGIARSRNKLIDLARGEYLAVMDHDDISLPERFAKEVSILDRNPDIGVVSCGYETIPEKKRFIFPENDRDIILALTLDCFVRHPAAMIRRSTLEETGARYDETYSPAEDYALWASLIGKTKFYNIPEVLFQYRLHETNTSKIEEAKMESCARKVRELIGSKHPELKREFEERAPHTVRMKLFGIIPCGKFVQTGSRRKGWLKYLPFITTKAKYRPAK